MAFFGELDAFRAFEQRPAERLVLDDVAQEQFPLDFEGVFVGSDARESAASRRRKLMGLSTSGFQVGRGVAA